MANVYVYSGAAGAGTGADWANAYTTLAAACTAKAAGDTFFVAHDHAETTASAMNISSPGNDTTPSRIYCVNRAGSVPPVSADLRTTATVSTTGASNLTVVGSWSECYGIIFSAGDGTNNAVLSLNSTFGRVIRYVNCAFRLTNTAATSTIQVGNSFGAVTEWNSCTAQFGDLSQRIGINSGVLIWRNTANAVTGTVPNPLLTFAAGGAGVYFIEGVDLAALSTGYTLVSQSGSGRSATFKDCKLGSGVTVSTNNTAGPGLGETFLIRCDSGDTNYRTEKYTFSGTQTTETTIVRTGGASDGTTPIAWKIVTTANSEWEYPFECLPISVWNETTGSAITVTIQGIWGGGAVPLNDEIWIDVEYLGTSGFPLAVKATSTKADGLATGTSIAAGSGTWGGSTTKFAMSATFTPQEKGPITIYVKAAKPSSTFYIDPKVTVS
jgi:hypothetical protein